MTSDTSSTSVSRETVALLLLCVVSFLVRVTLGLAFPNIFWPDEIFQTLEQGHRMVYGYGVTPWEFSQGIRSWFLPGVMGLVMGATSWLGEGSSGYLLGVLLFLSLLSLIPVVAVFSWTRRHLSLSAAVVASVIVAGWFEAVFFASKALSEVVASHIMFLGLMLCWDDKQQRPTWQLWLAGLALGLTFGLRVHFAPGLLLILLWALWKQERQQWSRVLGGFALAVVALGLLDWVTWGLPFQSIWKNFWVNVVEGKSKNYGLGISPWYLYAVMLWRTWSWGLIPLLVLAALGAQRLPLAGLVTLAIFAAHSFIGHKEYRFIYPCLILVVMLASVGLVDSLRSVLEKQAPRSRALANTLVALLVLSGSLGLGYRFNTHHTMNTFGGPVVSHWTHFQGSLEAFSQLSTETDVCGVAVWGMNKAFSGGYTYLHRRIPIRDMEKASFASLKKQFPYFNAMVTRLAKSPRNIGSYAKESCWGEICLYRRFGGCRPTRRGVR